MHWQPPILLESVESTQALLDSGMAEGSVMVAEHQTAGRGRFGRTWDAPPGSSLLMSALLKPPSERPLPQLALVAGIAVADALEYLTGLGVQIKWPNDVMLRRKKVCGILAEARDGAVVLGIGVNLNQRPDQLPDERAGSLYSLTGLTWERDDVLDEVLEALGARYDAWTADGLEAVYEGLGPRDFLRGRRVTVDGTAGTAAKIDRNGRLEIEVGHGDVVAVESGEVLYER